MKWRPGKSESIILLIFTVSSMNENCNIKMRGKKEKGKGRGKESCRVDDFHAFNPLPPRKRRNFKGVRG